MSFAHRHTLQAKPAATDHCLAIQGDRLLARSGTDASMALPLFMDLATWPGNSLVHPPLHTGLLDSRPLWLLAIDDETAVSLAGWDFVVSTALGVYAALAARLAR